MLFRSDDRLEPPTGSPPGEPVGGSSPFDTPRLDHEVLCSVFTLFSAGNRERLARVQGAAMSPLVAGTMPANPGMEALGLSPPRRISPIDRTETTPI